MRALRTNLEPFIDWISFSLKFKDSDFQEFSKYVQLASDEIIAGNNLRWKDVTMINRNEFLKLEFSGSFFKSKKAAENMLEVDDFLNQFYKKFKVHNFFESTYISRIDLSANDYMNTFANKFFVHTKRKQELTHFYRDNNVLKGIAIGKRGKNFVYYKCYDKREDTKSARFKATERFASYNFLRHEYELGRKFIREKGVGFKTDFKELFQYLFDIKRVDFNYGNNGNKKVFPNIKKQYADTEALEKQVIGIVKNHLMHKRTDLVDKICNL